MGLNDDEFLHPPVISKNMSTLKTFTKGMNTITDSILGSLSKSLSLPADGTLESYHRPAVPSSDIVRFLKYHAQPASERGAAHTPHTDLGSLTILFTRQPGLQVLPPKSDQWYYVAPRADHAIVNLGDGMATLSNNLFHTCLHRVSPLPNRAMETRYSFAYLQRAEDTTPMTGVKSALIPEISQEKVLTSSEWIQEKFRVLRLNTRRDNEDWVLTGQDRQREGIPV